MSLFKYTFANGTELELPSLSSEQLLASEAIHGKCVFNGWAEFMGVGKPSCLGVIGGSNTRGTGFKTGYNPALGMEIKSPSHYQQTLKERGLHEVGSERQKDSKRVMKSAIDGETIKEMKSMGAEISDREADKLTAPTEVN